MALRRDYYTTEHDEQVALIDWWNAVAAPEYRELLMAIPNGGERNALVGKRLKAEGVRRGVPDLFLAIPAEGCHGLWIEMKKAGGGMTSKDQKAMLALLRGQGYKAVVCHGWTAAMLEICTYLAGTEMIRSAEIGGVK